MTVEAIVASAADLLTYSVLLIAFGLDSVIELMTGDVLLWRLSTPAATRPKGEYPCSPPSRDLESTRGHAARALVRPLHRRGLLPAHPGSMGKLERPLVKVLCPWWCDPFSLNRWRQRGTRGARSGPGHN